MGFLWLALGAFPDPLAPSGAWDYSVSLTDRHGRELREILPPPRSRRERLELERFSPLLVEAVLAAEDKRFRRHLGVDPLAMLRALRLNLRRRSIVSGGSTITMQAARLSMGLAPGPRTIRRKAKEIFLALVIERLHAKDEILAFYLNSAPAGGPNLGFEAAARAWLGKSARELSPSEAAFLAALPASPAGTGPAGVSERTLRRWRSVLARLEKNGTITAAEARRALADPPRPAAPRRAFLAPHLVERVLPLLGPKPDPVVATTVDLDLQLAIERLAAATVDRFRSQGLSQVAVVVLSLPEREVLAYVGSGDFFDPADGQIDGAAVPRQPGSALKPFIYAQAIEAGAITAASLLPDRPGEFPAATGLWRPRNYSGGNHGLVSARAALASSLNLPAVNLALHLGVEPVLSKLRDLGLESLTAGPDHYGLGLALGDGEVTLLDLAGAYAALADGGRLRPPVFLAGAPATPPRLVLSPQAAFVVSDILSDPRARATGFGSGGPLATPYRASVKTGTSKNFRDNWCVGFTADHVVAVWAGNFQARPMLQVSGVSGAGHLWRQVSDRLAGGRPPAPRRIPAGVSLMAFCPISGLAAGPDCPNTKTEWVVDSAPPPARCDHRHQDPPVLGARAFIGARQAVGLPPRLNGLTGPRAATAAGIDPAGDRPAGGALAQDAPWEAGLPAGGAQEPLWPAAFGPVDPGRPPDAPSPRPAAAPAIGGGRSFGFLSPAQGEVLALDPDLPPAFQRLRAVAQSEPGVEELVFVLNGAVIGRRPVSGRGRAAAWVDLSSGPQILEVQAWSRGRLARRDTVRYTVR